MRWFIGDTHFNHENVIKYDNRPFKTVQEMEEAIIKKWNAVVEDADIVYHLGDFGFGSTEIQSSILSKLRGKKVLVRGNHDSSEGRCSRIGWDFVCDGVLIKIRGLSIMLVHDPDELPDTHLGVHGHTHKPSERFDRVCVSCNLWNYVPISETAIFKQLTREKL